MSFAKTITPDETKMFAEAGAAPAAVAAQAKRVGKTLDQLGETLRRLDPHLILTVGRGSSDYAATYAKYLIETRLGASVSSYAPSVSSVYRKTSSVSGAACLVISQSGRSPDILAAARSAKAGGAYVVALVNVEDAPLCDLADVVLPLCAHPEESVAATKSFLASLTMIARIVGAWTREPGLASALDGLPDALEQAWALDWSAALGVIAARPSLYVIGRGLGLSLAQEAALKFKETCRLHAEAYSAAEALHGPAAIIDHGFPVLAFSQNDETRRGLVSALDQLSGLGARVLIAGANCDLALSLPSIAADPAVEPIIQAQSFYRMVNQLSVELGYNPDLPPHLSKVTETL